jgi:hypothetical protein
LQWQSTTQTVASRPHASKSGRIEVLCGKCADWIGTKARTPEQAIPDLCAHQNRSNSCKDMTRRLGLLNALGIVQVGSAVSTLPAQQRALNPTPEVCVPVGLPCPCPGIPLLWSQLFSTYPFQMHDLALPARSAYRPKWRIASYDKETCQFYIRSATCSLNQAQPGSCMSHLRVMNKVREK